MDTLLKPVEKLGAGACRAVYSTLDPLWVRKCIHKNDSSNANILEAEIQESLPENDKFKVAACFLTTDGTGDLIMQRIHGVEVRHHPRCGEILKEASLFWHMVHDIHGRNVMVDREGIVWLVDYAGWAEYMEITDYDEEIW